MIRSGGLKNCQQNTILGQREKNKIKNRIQRIAYVNFPARERTDKKEQRGKKARG